MVNPIDRIDRIDIGDPVADICKRLGLEPRDVAELKIRPRDVTATVYKLNENGAKYLEPTVQILPGDNPEATDATGYSGQPVTETREFEVVT